MLYFGPKLDIRVLGLLVGIACYGASPPTHGGPFGTLGLRFCQNWGQFGTIGGFQTCADPSPEHFIDHRFGLGGSHANYRKPAMLQMWGTPHMAKYIYFEGPPNMPLAHD